MELANGWTVESRLERSPDATGSTFSVPYHVSGPLGGDDGRAFLKALDFSSAHQMSMPFVDALAYLTNAFVFERDLVMQCAGKKMSNVVRGIDQGEIVVDLAVIAPEYGGLSKVSYIIFEVADGDIHSAIASNADGFDLAWKLRVLHGVSNGLRQLHQAGISHQDVKASNVMTFGEQSKVGDLGRSSVAGGGGLFDDVPIAGDAMYAPPELLYGEMNQDERFRRRACDCYQLGSLLVFLLSGSGLTPLISAEMAPAFHWRTWPNDYRNVLPYVRGAFNRVMEGLAAGSDAVAPDVLRLVRELSDPDPQLRGNQKATGVTRLSMERYVSIFDRLAKSAELHIRAVG